MSSRLGTTLEMIKWEHSVFALPFALTGAMLAARGLPRWRMLFWIVVCMIAARSAAMAFNRWADAEIDRVNPRTASTGDSSGFAEPAIHDWIHDCGGGGFSVGSEPAESADAGTWLRWRWRSSFSIRMPSGSRTGRTLCWDWRWGLLPRRHGSQCGDRSIRASWC